MGRGTEESGNCAGLLVAHVSRLELLSRRAGWCADLVAYAATGRRSRTTGATTDAGAGSGRRCASFALLSPFLSRLTPSARRRIATEIKLHKKINTITYDFYRSVTPLGEGAFAALSDTRAWSWKLLFVAEIACVPCPHSWPFLDFPWG